MTTAHLIALLGVWAAAITSPGPDTVQLTRLATRSKTAALWAAIGIMIGNTTWITLSLAGMSALLDAHPTWTHTLEIAGGTILTWMGTQALRGGWAARRATRTHGSSGGPGGAAGVGAGTGIDSGAGPGSVQGAGESGVPAPKMSPVGGGTYTRAGALKLGIITNLSNPKAIIFFGAIFAQFLTPGMSTTTRAAVAALLIITGLAWFTGFALAAHTISARIRKHAPTIDMAAGAIFIAVGLSLATTGGWALIH